MVKIFKNALAAALVTAGTVAAVSGSAAAAGTATYSLSGSGSSHAVGSTFSVAISETSAEAVTGVQANVNYDASKLQCLGIDAAGSAFNQSWESVCGGGSARVARTILGGSVTGTQRVAALNFKVIAAGTAAMSMANTSSINDNSAAAADVWNHAAVSASYNLTTPAPAPAPTPAPTAAPKAATPKMTSQAAPAAQTPAQTTEVLGAETKPEAKAETPAETKAEAPAQPETTQTSNKYTIWKVLAGIVVAGLVIGGSIFAFRAIKAQTEAEATSK